MEVCGVEGSDKEHRVVLARQECDCEALVPCGTMWACGGKTYKEKHILEIAQGICVGKVGVAFDEGKTIKYKHTVAVAKRVSTCERMLLSDLNAAYGAKLTN